MYVSTAGRLDRMWTLDDVEEPELVVVTGHALPHGSKCRKSIHVFGCVLDQWRRNVFAPYQGRLGAAPPPPPPFPAAAAHAGATSFQSEDVDFVFVSSASRKYCRPLLLCSLP